MTTLLEEIRKISQGAASKLELKGYCTDQQIKKLDRQELLELLPGDDKLKMRKKIYEVICRSHEQNSIHADLADLKKCIPDETFRAPLSEQGPLREYLRVLKRLRCGLMHVQKSLEAHTDLLESLRLNLAVNSYEVKYKMVTNTLEKHLEVLEKLNGPVSGLDLVSLHLKETQHDEESQVTIVFCPVKSSPNTDAKAALMNVSYDKPVILVMMYQNHTPFIYLTFPNVVLAANVFCYENGPLSCTQNDEAIQTIQRKLLQYSTKTIQNK